MHTLQLAVVFLVAITANADGTYPTLPFLVWIGQSFTTCMLWRTKAPQHGASPASCCAQHIQFLVPHAAVARTGTLAPTLWHTSKMCRWAAVGKRVVPVMFRHDPPLNNGVGRAGIVNCFGWGIRTTVFFVGGEVSQRDKQLGATPVTRHFGFLGNFFPLALRVRLKTTVQAVGGTASWAP